MIKFINLNNLATGFSDEYDAVFDPETMRIYISKDLKKNYPQFWRRQLVATIMHEFVHVLEFIFMCSCNLEKFDKLENPEYRAEKIEYFVLRLMGVKCH